MPSSDTIFSCHIPCTPNTYTSQRVGRRQAAAAYLSIVCTAVALLVVDVCTGNAACLYRCPVHLRSPISLSRKEVECALVWRTVLLF